MQAVHAITGVTRAEIEGSDRTRRVSDARLIVYWLLTHGGMSASAVGRLLGRLPSTVSQGVAKVHHWVQCPQGNRLVANMALESLEFYKRIAVLNSNVLTMREVRAVVKALRERCAVGEFDDECRTLMGVAVKLNHILNTPNYGNDKD